MGLRRAGLSGIGQVMGERQNVFSLHFSLSCLNRIPLSVRIDGQGNMGVGRLMVRIPLLLLIKIKYCF